MGMDINLYSLDAPDWVWRKAFNDQPNFIRGLCRILDMKILKKLRVIRVDAIKYVSIGYCCENFREQEGPFSFGYPSLAYYNFSTWNLDFIITNVQNPEKKRQLREMKRIMKKSEDNPNRAIMFFTVSY